MAVYYISTNTIGVPPGFSFSGDGDSLVVLPGVTLASTSSFGSVIAFGSHINTSITILGTVVESGSIVNNSNSFDLTIGAGGTYHSTLSATTSGAIFTIVGGSQWTNAGQILAPNCIAMVAADTGISNSGTITGDTGIFTWSLDGTRISNSGLIQGTGTTGGGAYGTAVTFSGVSGTIQNLLGGQLLAHGAGKSAIRLISDVDGTRVVNHGSIESLGGSGIFIESTPTTATVTIVNTGTISGQDTAITGGDGVERVTNRGTLGGGIDLGGSADVVDNRFGAVLGDLSLGDGDDSYDGRGGSVSGLIDGGAGADSFIGNAALADIINGGVGLDEIDYRFGPAITLALDGSFESDGGAIGDTVTAVERILGSAGGDVVRGDAAANQLLGGAGNDALDGAAGADLMRGGQGADTLTGGLGNDTFRFQNLTECGDVITDFLNVAGDNDKFQILASAFGGGLVAGALAANQFQSRADNVAQDADDRFIFRTTDRTLWFDADGTGADAAIMVADLQAGAVVTAADIQLI
ncbi:MAG: calcium-binding protein [Fuscovulum sp.]|jgi:serralysin|nr:calcium-binding protein [Fuscovulum sp.]